ncbi:hypothetical protein ACIPPN_30245 [Streptomyces diastaticus]|uniref:hypothetical protein n=1 Tax=Streptomyces diastaticus TaxID=1956 RepID=UPI0037F45434
MAVVEVLRATGICIEELLRLSYHSPVQYRLPTTGELVLLLQIVPFVPSKTATERLLLVSPKLANILSAIICRIRNTTDAVPLVRSYDQRRTRVAAAPMHAGWMRPNATASSGTTCSTWQNWRDLTGGALFRMSRNRAPPHLKNC